MDICKEFKEHFGQSPNPIIKVKAPGRVNLIGGHTDYNQGFVFPVAIDKYITIAGQLRRDQQIKIYSLDFRSEITFNLGDLEKNVENPWTSYLIGVIYLLLQRGHRLQGMNLALKGNIPQGAGLSSSAALEIATAYLVKKLQRLKITAREIIDLCQQAENQFVGVNCGIMDQFICCLAEKNAGLLIDCQSLAYQPISVLDSTVSLVVTNTNVRHELADSAYNQRRHECELAVSNLRELMKKEMTTLREMTPQEFAKYGSQLKEPYRQRAEHVIFENQRVISGIQALQKAELEEFGRLMYQSHNSLKSLYQVSCRELDALVELAQQIPGVYGSRMTGGGFGGCTVSLVAQQQIGKFISYVSREYLKITGITADFYLCRIVDGAEIINRSEHATLDWPIL